ncbi:MAG: mechanosensitive ion channel family protein [archaeon]
MAIDALTGRLVLLENLAGGLIKVALIIILTVIAAKLVRRSLNRGFLSSSRVLHVQPTQYSFLKHILVAGVYLAGLTAVIYSIPPLRALSVSLMAGAGILAVVIGFASQQALSNIVSGIFIVIFKPFRVGDRIKIGTTVSGIVNDITLRHTVIKTFENKRIIIPNSTISNENIENSDLAEEKICKFIEFGIGYDSDLTKAKKIMREEAEKHPLIVDNRTKKEKQANEPVVQVRVIGITDSAMLLRAWAWAEKPGDAFQLGCDLYESIKLRFDRAGIEIPYPHRTVLLKKWR